MTKIQKIENKIAQLSYNQTCDYLIGLKSLKNWVAYPDRETFDVELKNGTFRKCYCK